MVVMVMVVQQRDGTMAAMGWRPAWCATLSFLLVLLLGQGAWTQHPGDHAGALEEDYTLLTYDYPAEGLDYYEYMDYYGPFTPNLANTTLRKCRCQVDQVWGDDHCQEATTYVNVIDLWAKHHVPANASDFGEVEVGEVICPKGHVKVVLDHNSGLRDAFFLLENGGLFWRDDTFPDYCIEHILDTSGKPTSMEAHICLPPPPVSLCCPPGHALLRNGTCYPDAAAVDVPLSMEVEGQHVTWVIESEGVVTNISCGSEDTYYKRLTEANVTLVYHPRGVVLQWLPPTQHNRPRDRHQYCLGVEVGAHGQVAQYSTLFCYTDMIAAYHEACHNATCIRKCCPEHTIMHGVECIPVHDPSKMWTPKFHERESLSPVASSPEDLTIVHGLPFCESFFKMRPDETEDDRYYLMEDGTVHAPSFSGFSYSAMQYCIDNFIADHPLQEHALLCFIDKTGCNSVQSMAIPALLAVSCVFLAITLLVYVSVPELHAKVHGKCLVSHVTALLLAYLCLIIVQWSAGRLPGAACKIMASLIHVSFLAAFFWLNVMCFDIWWTLKSMRPVAETGELSRLRFKMYSIYSWGCPLFISFVAIIVDSLPEDFDVIRPGFGEKKCWFGDNQPLWAYFYGFVLTLVVANILLFCQVAYILIMAQNDPILQRTRQQNRERMWLYIKLFVVMGLTWITEVISWQEGSCEPWIISDVINALQGFSIFLIFICKRNMLKRIRNNWEPYLRRMKVFVGSSRQPDSVKGKGAQDTSSFTSSVNRPSSQSGASQRTVQSQISLDTSSAFRREYKVALQTTRGKKKMLAAPRLNCAIRAWSAAIGTGFRRSTALLPPISSTTWQKVVTVSGCSYSHSTVGATISAVDFQPDEKILKVRWASGDVDSYPYLWLRDNCQCTKCFHPMSQSRRVMLKDLSLSLNCKDIKVVNDGERVEVLWTNDHLGKYDAQWLYERAFREPRNNPRDQEYRLQKKYWGRELEDNVPRASFSELFQSDSSLLAFLEDLETLGVVLVSDVPTEVDQIHLLSNHIGHMKKTHYGTSFDVVAKPDPNNLAYTGDSLDLHTDLPYLQDKPGIQLLHCIKQFTSEGGDTQLADGFSAALKLQEMNPKYYEILTQTMVDFVDFGIEDGRKFYASWRAPVIELDAEGTVKNINWNQMTRDSCFGVSSEAATLWYEATLTFRDIIQDENNLITRKLQPGDLLVFDNLRVLHGRTGYNAMQGERRLQGCYWEWDTVSSFRRVLRREMTA